MMHSLKFVVIVALSSLLAGCGLFKKYENKVATPDDTFGTTEDVTAAMFQPLPT